MVSKSRPEFAQTLSLALFGHNLRSEVFFGPVRDHAVVNCRPQHKERKCLEPIWTNYRVSKAQLVELHFDDKGHLGIPQAIIEAACGSSSPASGRTLAKALPRARHTSMSLLKQLDGPWSLVISTTSTLCSWLLRIASKKKIGSRLCVADRRLIFAHL